MIRNPNDSSLQAQIDELRQLLRANPLRSASVEAGRTRYYGGSELLIQDSNLTVTGTASVFGVLRVVGRALIEGLGQLVVSSLIDLLGMMRVRGGGSIIVEDGGDVVVNGGEIRVGDDIVIRDGNVYVGTGDNQIVINGATGKILAGDVEIELNKITVGGGDSPATLQDGALGFATGGKVEADTGFGGIRMSVGSAKVYAGSGGAAIQYGTRTVIVTAGGVSFLNLPTIPKSLTLDESPIGSTYMEPSGEFYRVVDG